MDVDGEANVIISGVAATSAVGSVTVHHNAQFSIDGVSATGDVGSVTITAKGNISITGVEATGSLGNVFVWSLIDDTQTKNYANINTDQSSSFAENNETQTPNWEEVA